MTIKVESITLSSRKISLTLEWYKSIYYLKSMQLTIIDELPFNGEDQNEGFLNIILIYTKEIDPNVVEIVKRIYSYTKYTSPNIQIITIINII